MRIMLMYENKMLSAFKAKVWWKKTHTFMKMQTWDSFFDTGIA